MPQPNRITIRLADNTAHNLPAMGREYSEASELITREDRASDGTLRRDVIAEKKTFTLVYDLIDNAPLLMFEDLVSNHSVEVLKLEVVRQNSLGADVVKIYNVMIRPFSRTRSVKGLWSGVSIELVEV